MRHHEIERRGEYWFIKGSSEPFETAEQAMSRLRGNTRKPQAGRFRSERLEMDFRSNWEIFIAETLEDLEVNWEFEPKRFYFRGEKESYLPDFYLPDFDVWIEVKGYMDKRSKRRIRLFKKYEKPNFVLIEGLEMDCIKKEPTLLLAMIVSSIKE